MNNIVNICLAWIASNYLELAWKMCLEVLKMLRDSLQPKQWTKFPFPCFLMFCCGENIISIAVYSIWWSVLCCVRFMVWRTDWMGGLWLELICYFNGIYFFFCCFSKVIKEILFCIFKDHFNKMLFLRWAVNYEN